MKYIVCFLKQQHIGCGPDSSLPGTLCRHSHLSKNACTKLPGQFREFSPSLTIYTRCTATCSQEVPDHNAESVWARFAGRCYLLWRGRGNRAVPFSPVLSLDVAHGECHLLLQAEGTEGLYCDQRKAVHCPSALCWVVILNVNHHKVWAITSLVSWIYYQQPALPIDLKMVLLYITTTWSHFSGWKLQLIASPNDIGAGFTAQLALTWLPRQGQGRCRRLLAKLCWRRPWAFLLLLDLCYRDTKASCFLMLWQLQDWVKSFVSPPLLYVCPLQAFFLQLFMFHYWAPTLASAAPIIRRLFPTTCCLLLLYWFVLFPAQLAVPSLIVFARAIPPRFILSSKRDLVSYRCLGSIWGIFNISKASTFAAL